MKNRLRQKYRNYCIIAFNATEKSGVFFVADGFFGGHCILLLHHLRGVSRGDLPFLQFKKLKVHSHQFRSVWKLINSMALGWDICHAWYFLKLNSSFNFYWAFEVLKQPTPNTYSMYDITFLPSGWYCWYLPLSVSSVQALYFLPLALWPIRTCAISLLPNQNAEGVSVQFPVGTA